MQMLAQASEENMSADGSEGALIDCLGIVPGRIRLMEVGNLRLPHMGWNQIEHDETHPLLKGIPSGSYFYFVHSYALEVTDATLATCDYGLPFTAIVGRDNFFGAQFHRSDPARPVPAYCKTFWSYDRHDYSRNRPYQRSGRAPLPGRLRPENRLQRQPAGPLR